MKILAIIMISGAAGVALGWMVCAILSASKRADECAGCHLSRTLEDRSR